MTENAKLVELFNKADALCKERNALINSDEPIKDGRTVTKIDGEIDEVIADYTKASMEIVFEACYAAENPMLEACTRCTYPIIVAPEKENDAGEVIRQVDTKKKEIDLLALHCYKCSDGKTGIGANPAWVSFAQVLNQKYACNVAYGIGAIDQKTLDVCIASGADLKKAEEKARIEAVKNIANTLVVSEILTDLRLGRNPFSNTHFLKNLQKLVDLMLGPGYKATSRDVRFLKECYSKYKGIGKLSLPKHKTFCKYMLSVCHRIVTNGYNEFTI